MPLLLGNAAASLYTRSPIEFPLPGVSGFKPVTFQATGSHTTRQTVRQADLARDSSDPHPHVQSSSIKFNPVPENHVQKHVIQIQNHPEISPVAWKIMCKRGLPMIIYMMILYCSVTRTHTHTLGKTGSFQ